MRARYTGPAMTLENMRQQGVRMMAAHSLFVAIAMVMAKGVLRSPVRLIYNQSRFDGRYEETADGKVPPAVALKAPYCLLSLNSIRSVLVRGRRAPCRNSQFQAHPARRAGTSSPGSHNSFRSSSPMPAEAWPQGLLIRQRLHSHSRTDRHSRNRSRRCL
jgi:hypothetical protein